MQRNLSELLMPPSLCTPTSKPTPRFATCGLKSNCFVAHPSPPPKKNAHPASDPLQQPRGLESRPKTRPMSLGMTTIKGSTSFADSNEHRSLRNATSTSDPRKSRATHMFPINTLSELQAHGVRFHYNALERVRQIATSSAGMGSRIKPITGLCTYLLVLYWGISSESALRRCTLANSPAPQQ